MTIYDLPVHFGRVERGLGLPLIYPPDVTEGVPQNDQMRFSIWSVSADVLQQKGRGLIGELVNEEMTCTFHFHKTV